jgi:carbohydrate-binding DOMON domain-containing protein
MVRKPDKEMSVLVLPLLEKPSWFILPQCMITEQTYVLIISHTKLKILIKACRSYVVKDLLAHFTFAHLLCRYNFKIKISCTHTHTHTHTHTNTHTNTHTHTHTHTQKLTQVMYI